MTFSYWHCTARAPEVRCDVAIVGGGVIGCAAAYWLRRLRPQWGLAIIEKGHLASGASGRNAGFLLQGSSRDYCSEVEAHGTRQARRLWQFTRENRDLMFSELPAPVVRLQPSGSLTVAGTREEDDRLQASVAPLRAEGVPVVYLPAPETNQRLSARGFFGALYLTSNGCLNPVCLVRHLAAESGARVLEHHPVLAVGGGEGNITVETPSRSILARKVVLAMNAYLPQLYPALASYVRPVRAQMLATEPVASRWLPMPVYSHEGYYYLRQAADGTLLLGGARHLHVEEEVGYVDETTPALQADLECYLHTYFSPPQGLRVVRRWSGVMGFSPDQLPVVGEVPGLPGNHWAAGFSGHGLGYGFRFGRLLAELTLGIPEPEGLDLFTTARFARPAPSARSRASEPAG